MKISIYKTVSVELRQGSLFNLAPPLQLLTGVKGWVVVVKKVNKGGSRVRISRRLRVSAAKVAEKKENYQER